MSSSKQELYTDLLPLPGIVSGSGNFTGYTVRVSHNQYKLFYTVTTTAIGRPFCNSQTGLFVQGLRIAHLVFAPDGTGSWTANGSMLINPDWIDCFDDGNASVVVSNISHPSGDIGGIIRQKSTDNL